VGRQVLGLSFPPADPPQRVLRDNGHGSMVRRWDHRIVLRPDGGRTHYSDQVRLDAGWLTPIILPWARRFYAHRQRRWHLLIANGCDPVQ